MSSQNFGEGQLNRLGAREKGKRSTVLAVGARLHHHARVSTWQPDSQDRGVRRDHKMPRKGHRRQVCVSPPEYTNSPGPDEAVSTGSAERRHRHYYELSLSPSPISSKVVGWFPASISRKGHAISPASFVWEPYYIRSHPLFIPDPEQPWEGFRTKPGI